MRYFFILHRYLLEPDVRDRNPVPQRDVLAVLVQRVPHAGLRGEDKRIADTGDGLHVAAADHCTEDVLLDAAVVLLFEFLDNFRRNIIAPDVNMEDLLFAGAILHDIAKIGEFEASEQGVVSGYTVRGSLIGHLVDGAMAIEKAGEKLGTDKNLLMLLEHMIISHHGEPEFGAAVRPMFLEAEILSQLDLLDARIYEFSNAVAPIKPGEFSSRQWALDNRKLYNPGLGKIDPKAKLF